MINLLLVMLAYCTYSKYGRTEEDGLGFIIVFLHVQHGVQYDVAAEVWKDHAQNVLV